MTKAEKKRFVCQKCKERVTQWGSGRPVWSGERDFGGDSSGVTMCECPRDDCPHHKREEQTT